MSDKVNKRAIKKSPYISDNTLFIIEKKVVSELIKKWILYMIFEDKETKNPILNLFLNNIIVSSYL